MKKYFFIFTILLINVHAQRVATTSIASTFVPQGHVLSSINSMGFSRFINQQVSNLGNINPASLSQFENLSFGISYQFETDVTQAWLADMGHSRTQLFKPQCIALIIDDGAYNYALSFHQRYNSYLDFGELQVTTVEQQSGAGETVSAHLKEQVDTYSSLLSYTFYDDDNEISLGAKLDVNILNYEEKIGNFRAHGNGYSFSASLGLNYQLDDKIKMGVFYERAPKFEEKVKLENSAVVRADLDTSRMGNNQTIVAYLPESSSLKNKMPDILNLALSVRHNETYTSVFDLTYIFWEQYSKNSNNNLDISSSILISLQEDVIFSFGFLLTDRDYGNETDSFFGTNSKLDGLFLLAGLKEKMDTFDLNFAVVSSHLGSGKWREQLIGKFGIDYYF